MGITKHACERQKFLEVSRTGEGERCGLAWPGKASSRSLPLAGEEGGGTGTALEGRAGQPSVRPPVPRVRPCL